MASAKEMLVQLLLQPQAANMAVTSGPQLLQQLPLLLEAVLLLLLLPAAANCCHSPSWCETPSPQWVCSKGAAVYNRVLKASRALYWQQQHSETRLPNVVHAQCIQKLGCVAQRDTVCK